MKMSQAEVRLKGPEGHIAGNQKGGFSSSDSKMISVIQLVRGMCSGTAGRSKSGHSSNICTSVSSSFSQSGHFARSQPVLTAVY